MQTTSDQHTLNDAPQVRILILKQTNEESKNIQTQLEKVVLQLPQDVKYVIEEKMVKSTEKQTAEMINQDHYDIVIVSENVTLSAWKLTNQAVKPIYYLAGNVEDILNREIKETSFSGSIAINKDDKPLYRAAQGESNTPATQFNIASIVKMMTSIGIIRLVEDTLKIKYGPDVDIYKIPIQQLLPSDFAYKERFRDFTFHELLTHTSGLHDTQIFEPFYGSKELYFKNPIDFVESASSLYQHQSLETRGKQMYCNYGFFLLGLAIQAITGMTYYDFICQQVLMPAHMTHTQPSRGNAGTVAIPDVPESIFTLTAKPSWLQEMAADESDMELNLIAITANKLFNDLQKLIQSPSYSFVKQLESDFKQRLADMDDKYEKAFVELRNDLFRKIDVAYTLLGTRDTAGLYHFLYDDKEQQLIDTFHQLVAWEERNPKQSQKVAMLKELLGPNGLYNHLRKPIDILCSLQINLSIGHPAGCWFSTIEDLSAFTAALWNKDGPLNRYAQKMLEGAQAEILQFGYGYGLIVYEKDGINRRGHTGGAPGISTSCFTYPDQNMTVIALANNNGPAQIQLTDQIEKNLVCSSIRYLDRSVSPNAGMKLRDDIISVHHNKMSALNFQKKLT